MRLGRLLVGLVLFLGAPWVAEAQIRLTVIVNTDHYTISAADLAWTVANASETLQAKTGKTYVYKGPVFGKYGSQDAQTIFNQYVMTHAKDPSDYVVVFTKHLFAMQSGGLTLTAFGRLVDSLKSELQSMPGYCNPAGSPYLPPGTVYGTVLDWHHLLGCGYELQGLNQVHVSATSFGGQCKNTSGLTCVFQFNEWQCPNLLNDPVVGPMIADRRLLTALSINHELLHNFGWRGGNDHSCKPGTPQNVVDQGAFNMCGTNVVALKAAAQRCVLDKRPAGTICTHGSQCLNSACYEFGQPIEYQCSHVCASAAACESVPGKDPTCRLRRLDIPTTDLSCYYQPKP